jgi:hypothetical protein
MHLNHLAPSPFLIEVHLLHVSVVLQPLSLGSFSELLQLFDDREEFFGFLLSQIPVGLEAGTWALLK